jgi:glutathione S-transferase
MILIGQYDSPFVRRVGVALHLYGLPYEHRPWSTFGDADKIAPFNPLRRVPTLVLDDGTVVIESGAILDCLDEMVGPDRAMMTDRGLQRRAELKVCALATGLADKAVSLVYERVLHETASNIWTDRCRTQIAGVLDALNVPRETPFWFGDRIGHADIAVTCALRFLKEAHPGLFDPARWPALAAHATRCEALPAFQAVVQVFLPPQK